MVGELYINDKDAWLTWAVKLAGTSYENLLQPGPMKSYVKNNFRTQSGQQVFIINPKKDARQVILSFAMTCDSRSEYLVKYKSFKDEISDGLIKLRVSSINETFDLYMEDAQSLNLGLGFTDCLMSIRFNESLSVPVVFEALDTEREGLLLTEDGKTILI